MASATYATARSQLAAKLNSGHSIPLLGYGTWKIAKKDVLESVRNAIQRGCRHIDCAAIYGNEEEVGNALKVVFSEGVVKREDLFVTSKLWNSEHEPEKVEPAIRKTLGELKLDYLDLYLVHWPSSLKPGSEIYPPLIETWRAMESVSDKGLARSIGVSNLSPKKLEALCAQARITPAANQVEMHPVWRNDAVFEYCRGKGIHVQAYSPLGSPDSAELFPRDPSLPSPLSHPTVVEVAKRVGKTPGQVLLKWALQRGTSVLPKAVQPGHIVENMDVFDWSLPDSEFKTLSSIPGQARLLAGTFLVHPEGPYKRPEDLWDEPLKYNM